MARKTGKALRYSEKINKESLIIVDGSLSFFSTRIFFVGSKKLLAHSLVFHSIILFRIINYVENYYSLY